MFHPCDEREENLPAAIPPKAPVAPTFSIGAVSHATQSNVKEKSLRPGSVPNVPLSIHTLIEFYAVKGKQ